MHSTKGSRRVCAWQTRNAQKVKKSAIAREAPRSLRRSRWDAQHKSLPLSAGMRLGLDKVCDFSFAR
jgi:hypothetical protein